MTSTLRPTETPLPPTVTPAPTVDVAALSTEAVADMGVWRRVAADYAYPVVQVSDTPLGVRVVSGELDDIPGTDAGCLSSPQWALGGEKVVASVLLQDGVWVMDRNGAVQRLPADGEVRARHYSLFSLSHDGRYVAYSGGAQSFATTGAIYDLVSQTVMTRTLFTADSGVWSPVAPQLMFDDLESGLLLLDVMQGQTVVVGSADVSADDLLNRGAWSPDGSRFAYWRTGPDGHSLWLWTPDEASALLLESVEPARGQWNPHYRYDMTPQWRPDGRAIAVVAILDGQPEVYLVELP